MTVLVTGACGFMGCALVEELVAAGETVVGADIIDPPQSLLHDLKQQPGTATFEKIDVCDGEALERLLAGRTIERVVHTATVTANEARDRAHPDSVINVNLLGTTRILMACRDAGVRQFVFASSSAAYGRTVFATEKLTEDAQSDPHSLYEVTKFAAERVVLRLGGLYGIDVRIGRLSTVYGPWERNTGVRDTLSPMLQIYRNAQRGEDALLERPGERDWIHVRDAAHGLLTLFTVQKDAPLVYNVGPGQRWSALDWGRKLAETVPGFACRVASEGETANVLLHQPEDRATLDTDRIERYAGFKARYDLATGLADYGDWLKKHPGFL